MTELKTHSFAKGANEWGTRRQRSLVIYPVAVLSR